MAFDPRFFAAIEAHQHYGVIDLGGARTQVEHTNTVLFYYYI